MHEVKSGTPFVNKLKFVELHHSSPTRAGYVSPVDNNIYTR